MSFAEQGDQRASGSARKTPRTPRTPRGGVDDAFQLECRKVQEAVQKMQETATGVRKEATFLHGKAKSKADVKDWIHDAKASGENALSALRSLMAVQGLSVDEQNNRRLLVEKLTGDLQVSGKTLDLAWSTYEVAEAEYAKRLAVVANSSTEALGDSKADLKKSLLSSGDPSIEPGLPPANGADDVEANRQALAQQQQDMSAEEMEIHANMTNEYVSRLRTVNEDVRTISGVMNDLATLTKTQGEVMDDIESNLSAAADNTAAANEQVAQTENRQAQRSKRFLWVLVFAGALAGVGALLT